MNIRIVLLGLLFICAHLIYAQPEVTQTDVLNLVNGKGIWEISGEGSIPIDLGQAGPDQVWDFRNIEMGNPIEYELRINKTEGSLYGDRYSTSDHVLINTQVINPAFKVFSYLNVLENRLQIVSRVIDNAGDLNFSYTHPDYYIPLPLTYGATWQSIETDTADWGAQGIYVFKFHYDNVVDAYGTVRLPVGDIQCLRLRTYVVNVSNSPDTVRTYEYTWIAKNNLLIAIAKGTYNDPNPDFATASYFERFKSIQRPTGLFSRTKKIPSDYELKPNYPNPFNPSTSIEYTISNSEYVRLEVYNTSGQKIKTLLADFQLAGQYEAVWDGTNESGQSASSGIYIYRLTTQTTLLSKRMVLMK